MTGILGTALSGLMAFQRSLETTSHNIANVNTEGYSRQRAELATKPELFIGPGFIGQGVNVANVTRSYDQFITAQVRTSASAFGEADKYQKLASQVDNLMADSSTGLSPAIKRFFNAVHELADDPTSIPARQVMLSEAEILTQRFHTMDARFNELRAQVNQDINSKVDSINMYATAVADLNQRIVIETGKTPNGQMPNDLLDQRDNLLLKMSELIDISVVADSNGGLSVFTGQGQSLVLGGQSNQLEVRQSELDPARLNIAIQGGGDITRNISGGELAGALRFRDEVLDPAQQKLGRVAISMATEFNAVHTAGYDLAGNAGVDFFSGIDPAAVPVVNGAANSAGASIAVGYSDVSAMDFSDYQLDFDGASYKLTRINDKSFQTLTPAQLTNAVPGLTITPGTLAAGDSFLIKPASQGAQSIGVNITDPLKIAAATNAAVDSDGNAYVVNGPMPGDNRNALALAALENKGSMLGGVSTFAGGYGQIVSEVGTLTHAATVSVSAQETLLNQAKGSFESLAGVNLDEEAANLIKFQQSYQAAAQVISMSGSLFDSLLGAIR
ncbi:MAG: flagellar hook-associated protein FlgK [Methylobacter sp.]|uniref:flagellar hook-associated protein FlgK n=1 Tax=Methylobacter sp. TaxID=2051955 RepID=UPI00258A9C88|nr:flagellar hook-associated protein FlgK [Methylobacter sp.]MCL7419379.1 flagellar hook-associated protein FlgK [Methylobacter sp.]